MEGESPNDFWERIRKRVQRNYPPEQHEAIYESLFQYGILKNGFETPFGKAISDMIIRQINSSIKKMIELEISEKSDSYESEKKQAAFRFNAANELMRELSKAIREGETYLGNTNKP